jgi:hypothetical protein
MTNTTRATRIPRFHKDRQPNRGATIRWYVAIGAQSIARFGVGP